MASRLLRPTRHTRRACAAVGVAAFLFAGAAWAQNAGDLGLRGADAPDAAGTPAGQETTNGTGGTPPDRTQEKPKLKPSQVQLSRLQPHKGAERLDQRGVPKARSDSHAPAPTVAALPAPPPRRPRQDDKPFDPLGISIGALRLKPYIEEDIGWSSNPELVPGSQKSSAFLMSQAGFALDSDWSSSALRADMKGGLTDYFSNPAADTPFANGDINGRLDVTRDLSFDAGASLALATLSASSLGLASNVGFGSSGAPLTATYGAALGGNQKFGRLDLSLHGSLDRTVYGDTSYSDGAVDDLSSDDFNDWGLRGRATWRVSPVLTPFLDVLVDSRLYDAREDQFGYQRSSDGIAVRVGGEIDLSKVLTGSVDIGYGLRNYQNPRLANVTSPLFDASLTWTATPLTSVALKSVSSIAETTQAGAAADVQHTTTLEVDHALRRWLALCGTVSYATDLYAGLPWRDATTTFGLSASYNINRDVVLKASASRQFYVSNQPGTNYTATILMMGVKLQR